MSDCKEECYYQNDKWPKNCEWSPYSNDITCKKGCPLQTDID